MYVHLYMQLHDVHDLKVWNMRKNRVGAKYDEGSVRGFNGKNVGSRCNTFKGKWKDANWTKFTQADDIDRTRRHCYKVDMHLVHREAASIVDYKLVSGG